IGLGLTGFGVFFTFLGVVFLFDKGLLAMGNVHPLLVWVGTDNRIEIHSTIFHEAAKLQGDNILWRWLLLCSDRVANTGNDIGVIWVSRTLQWLLAYIGGVCAKNSCSWLDISTTLLQICMQFNTLLSVHYCYFHCHAFHLEYHIYNGIVDMHLLDGNYTVVFVFDELMDRYRGKRMPV
ncbi:hypothetical protein KSS87_018306, partial [Heliosperma pusillum]